MPAQYPGNSATKAARAKAGGGFESAIEVAAGGWRANEPAGLTAWPALNFDDTTANTTGWNGYDVANLQYVTDATSPSTGDNVGRLIYPAGFEGGFSTVNIGPDGDGIVRKTIYFCIGLKMSANFQYHSTGTNKVFFINDVGYGGGGDPFVANIDSDTDPARWNAVLQGDLPRVFTPSPDAAMVKGRWYVLEGLLKMNSPGLADGAYKQWVTDTTSGAAVLTHDLADVEYVNTSYDFSIPKLQNTWGGLGDTVVEQFHLDVSELYVSWSESV